MNFTWLGLLLVFGIIAFFIRSKVVIGFLAIILVGLLLINYKSILPLIVKKG